LQVYSDLEVAFAISEDASVYKALSQTIELMEGHTSMISQHYYGCLFHELLAFQIVDRHPQQEVNKVFLLQVGGLSHNSSCHDFSL
jgi:methionine S-methyltransferase